MSFVKPLVPEWLQIVGLFAAIALIVVCVFYALPASRCGEVGDVSGKATQYRLISGCYVQVDERWIPLSSWRGEQER